MIPERHKERHLHASLLWRRLGRFIAATVAASFVLNEFWEMAQMSAYVETSGRPWASTLEFCTRAAVGDVGIVLGLYATGALATADLGWGLRGSWNIYLTVAVQGLACATLVVSRRALVLHGTHARGALV